MLFMRFSWALQALSTGKQKLNALLSPKQTALHLACLTAQSQIVRRLIASGATINLIDEHGNTGLHLACRTGDLNLVKQFFQPITKNEAVSAKLSYGVSTNSFSFQKFILNEKNFEGNISRPVWFVKLFDLKICESLFKLWTLKSVNWFDKHLDSNPNFALFHSLSFLQVRTASF